MRKEGINLTTILILLNAMTITISRSDDGIINDEIGIFWKEKKKKRKEILLTEIGLEF